MVPYENNSVSLLILDGSLVSGSDKPKLRKQHIYRAAKAMGFFKNS